MNRNWSRGGAAGALAAGFALALSAWAPEVVGQDAKYTIQTAVCSTSGVTCQTCFGAVMQRPVEGTTESWCVVVMSDEKTDVKIKVCQQAVSKKGCTELDSTGDWPCTAARAFWCNKQVAGTPCDISSKSCQCDLMAGGVSFEPPNNKVRLCAQ